MNKSFESDVFNQFLICFTKLLSMIHSQM